MKQLLFYLKIIFGSKKNYENDDEYIRLRGIALTAITAMLAKIIAVLTPLITVKINLRYMGEEVYGLWSAVVSLFTMFTYADLGLGSGLQTELSRKYKDVNESRKLISSSYILLTGISVLLLVVFLIIYPFLNWAEIVNAESADTIAIAGAVVLAIVIPRIVNVPFSLINRVELAYQEGFKYNLWQIAGNIINLIAIIGLSYTNLGPLALIWASSLVTVIISILNTVVFFLFQKKEVKIKFKFFDKKYVKDLLKVGIMFFILSIFTTLSLSIDNFIVAKAQGLAEVTSYSIMYKIVSMISVVSAMLSTPMWTANGDALARGDVQWVKKATNKITLVSFALSFLASVGVLVLISPALKILTDGVVKPDYMLLVGMCLYQIIVSITNPYFMILNSTKKIVFQIINYIIFSVISLPLKYYCALNYGVVSVTWVGVITYFLILTISTFVMSQITLKKEGKKYVNQEQSNQN